MDDLFNAAQKRVPSGNCWGCNEPTYKGEPHFCKPQASARVTDPATSHLAAKQVESSGKAGSQRRKCHELVKSRPGVTYGEAQEALGFPAHKRLPELRKAGLVYNGSDRICTVNGTLQATWWPVTSAPALPPFYDALGAVAE